MYMSSRHITLLVVVLSVFVAGLNAVKAVPITALPQEQATAPGFYSARSETAKVTPRANIPEGPVHMFIRHGERSRFELFFLDVQYDYDVVDFEFYNAWCLEKDKKIGTNAVHQVKLYNVYDEDLPPEFKTMPWNQINYIINHKEESKTVTQDAIWYLSDKHRKPVSPEAMRLIEKAERQGKDFQPGEGELLAIICRAEGKQPVFIEFRLPVAEVVAAFPVSYEPPPTMPEVTGLSPWLPLGLLPMIPPFFLTGGSSEPPLDTLPPDSIPDTIPETIPETIPPIIPGVFPTPYIGPTPGPIPEPASVILMGSGLAGIYVSRKILKRRAKEPQ
jgi:hypothetical protein